MKNEHWLRVPEPSFPVVLLGLGAIVAALVAVVVVALVMMKKKTGQKVQQTYERSTQPQQSDRSKYYQKK